MNKSKEAKKESENLFKFRTKLAIARAHYMVEAYRFKLGLTRKNLNNPNRDQKNHGQS